MAALRQTSFAAGELSPRLWGRTDLDLFSHGARTLKNHVVLPQGAAASRPGMELFETAKTSDIVLLPFIFSDDVAYVLECGENYIRVHHPDTGYTGTELVTTYSAAELKELQWAQVGQLMMLTHQNHVPMEIAAPQTGVRTTWVFRQLSFSPPCDSETAAARTPIPPWYRKADGTLTGVPYAVDNPAGSLFVYDASHPPREWRWLVSTRLKHKVTGEERETYAVGVGRYFDGATATSVDTLPADGLVVLFGPDTTAGGRGVLFKHPSFAAVQPAPTNWDFVGLNWYRGRGGLYGFIGATTGAQDFFDVGDEPNYAVQPLISSSSPFASYEYPGACAYFQGRRLVAGTPMRPTTLWASWTDEWSNLKRPFPPFIPKDAALETAFAARRREAIRSMVPHHRLLVLTDSSVWSFGGSNGALAPDDMEFRLEDEIGAEKLQPLVVDGAVLYVRAKGRGVRALTFDTAGSYSGRDITWQSEHLFRGENQQILSWCFQRDPWATIWAVRADGVLLSCTRTGPSTWAWSRCLTGEDAQDSVVSVVSVPGARRDLVFVAVSRFGVTYIEKMVGRDVATSLPLSDDEAAAALAVDSFVSHLGDTSTTFAVSGLDHLKGRDVWAVAPGNPPQGPLRVSGGAVTVGPFEVENTAAAGKVQVYVGLPFTADIETLDAMRAGPLQQKTVISVGFEVDDSNELQAGEDFDHLVAAARRKVSDSYEFPSAASELVVVRVKGKWAKTGRAVLRQSKPLPLMVLGITRELDTGGV